MSINNRQVAHIWAQGNGAKAKGSNFRCEDNMLYSYSTLIGCILDGQIYLSASNMTPTTGKQLSYARQACSYNYFSTPFFQMSRHLSWPQVTHSALITAAADVMPEAFQELLKKRKPDTERYNERRQEIVNIAAKFNVSLPDMPVIPDNLTELGKQVRAEQRERTKQARIAQEARDAARRAEDKEQFDNWLTTGQGSCPYSFRKTGSDYITIKTRYEEQYISTSQGAEAPLDHVVKALRFYISRKVLPEHGHNPDGDIYNPYQTNGHKIPLGHFTLDSIDEAGNVKAGCHKFTSEEITRFMAQWREVLGL